MKVPVVIIYIVLMSINEIYTVSGASPLCVLMCFLKFLPVCSTSPVHYICMTSLMCVFSCVS